MAVHQRNTAASHAQEPPLTIARVALYARVSTCNGQDPEMQLRELREYAARRGWTVTSEYVDHGVSGSKESRPQLNQLMADAHWRKFDAVLVWKIDRFGRSLKHLVNALAEPPDYAKVPQFREHGLRLHRFYQTGIGEVPVERLPLAVRSEERRRRVSFVHGFSSHCRPRTCELPNRRRTGFSKPPY